MPNSTDGAASISSRSSSSAERPRFGPVAWKWETCRRQSVDAQIRMASRTASGISGP